MLVLIALTDPAAPAAPCEGFAVEGELVVPFGLECTEPDRCRCRRSWSGLSTLGFTSLAEVAERPDLTRDDLRRSVRALFDRLGYVDDIFEAFESGDEWFEGIDISDPFEAVERIVDDHVADIELVCSHFRVGTVLSRLGGLVAEAVSRRVA